MAAPHPCHITAHREGFAVGVTPVVTRGGPHECNVDFAIVRQRAGERIAESDVDETAWVLLEGRARVAADGTAPVAVSRASVFDERPTVLHVASGHGVALHADSDVEWARVRTTNTADFPSRLFLPDETTSEARGRGLVQDAALRVVRQTFDLANRPLSMLVVGEVVNLPGRWSSYPPHHHAQPELYHYRFTRPQGYGHAELGDDVLKVKHNDTVKITGGVDHPQVAAPGYGMYYLWIVRHDDDAPYRGFTFTDAHAWILEGKDAGWAPKDLL